MTGQDLLAINNSKYCFMKKIDPTAGVYYPPLFVFIMLLAVATGCKKEGEPAAAAGEQLQAESHNSHSSGTLKGFLQVNLVASNSNYGAANIDPGLINGWGIAFSATGTPWVAAQGGHVSTIYNREGVTALPSVHIPSPGGDEGGNPTGVVFNPNATDFLIPSGNGTDNAAARFIFAGVDGIIAGWNGTWGTHSYTQFDNSFSAGYTGLTLATYKGNNYLYAADFRTGKIAVWDTDWNPVTTMSFRDRRLPSEASPFNIQAIGEYLVVTYAKVGPDGKSEHGQGLGIVNVFTTGGKFVSRFADGDQLNAPWGVAQAPASFFPQKEQTSGGRTVSDRHNSEPQPALLIGNFGDGKISVYDLDGKFLGLLQSSGRKPLVIDGLWAITFPPATSTIDPNRLYFAAGPKLETEGLFGYIIKDSLSFSD